jgi:hypothetical protein
VTSARSASPLPRALALCALAAVGAGGGRDRRPEEPAAAGAAAPAAGAGASAAASAPTSALDAAPAERTKITERFEGDLDALRERTLVRALVAQNHFRRRARRSAGRRSGRSGSSARRRRTSSRSENTTGPVSDSKPGSRRASAIRGSGGWSVVRPRDISDHLPGSAGRCGGSLPVERARLGTGGAPRLTRTGP